MLRTSVPYQKLLIDATLLSPCFSLYTTFQQAETEICKIQDGITILKKKECPAPRSHTSGYRLIPLTTLFLLARHYLSTALFQSKNPDSNLVMKWHQDQEWINLGPQHCQQAKQETRKPLSLARKTAQNKENFKKTYILKSIERSSNYFLDFFPFRGTKSE